MCATISRRCFLETAAVGVMSSGAGLAQMSASTAAAVTAELVPKTKVRVGLVYLGRARPGWPMSAVDLDAEIKRYEEEMARLSELADVEFVRGGLVSTA
jgi:hypothetical protein